MTRAEWLKDQQTRFHVGDEVYHMGAKRWCRVAEVRPTKQGVELRIPERRCESGEPMWWPGYLIAGHRRDGKELVTP